MLCVLTATRGLQSLAAVSDFRQCEKVGKNPKSPACAVLLTGRPRTSPFDFTSLLYEAESVGAEFFYADDSAGLGQLSIVVDLNFSFHGVTCFFQPQLCVFEHSKRRGVIVVLSSTRIVSGKPQPGQSSS